MKRRFSIGGLAGLAGCVLMLGMALVGAASAAGQGQSNARQAGVAEIAASTITATFTYQGQLKQGGAAVSGPCNMAFRLYDDPSGGDLIGSPITTTVPISNGLFTAGLNFGGGAFMGDARWLDIRVRCPAGSGSYTPLAPRQALTAAPYALAFGAPGSVYGYLYDAGPSGLYPTIGFNTYGAPSYRAGATGYGGVLQFHNEDGSLIYYTGSNVAAGQGHDFTPRLTIRDGGNVGIGTVIPLTKLHVRGNTTSSSNNTAVFENTAIGPYASAIHYGTKGDWYIRSASGLGKVIIQDTGGNVGIGTASPNDRLEVGGELRVANCVKNSGGTPIAGTCPSDARLKTNVVAFPKVLDQVTQLQPVYFNWRANEYPYYHFDGSTRSYGVIAQDVEQLLPELVGSDEHGFKTVNYGEMPLLLLQALKDLRAEKDAQIAAQQKRIDDLQARLANSAQNAQPASFNMFNLLSVIAIGAVIIMLWQQRRSRRGDTR